MGDAHPLVNSIPTESFVRRNKDAELEARLDEADQRTFNVLERLKDWLGADGSSEDELGGVDHHGDAR